MVLISAVLIVLQLFGYAVRVIGMGRMIWGLVIE